MKTPFRLTWGVSPDGYRVENGHLAAVNSERIPEPYNPFNDGSLWGTFEGLAITPDEITAFADKYGQLRTIFGETEPLDLWEKEVRLLKQAVWLWEKWRDQDTHALSACIQWKGDRLVLSGIYNMEGDARDYVRTSSDTLGDDLARFISSGGPTPLPLLSQPRFKKNDLLTPAIALVSLRIQEKLHAEVSAGFEHDSGFYFRLNSLVGAMWAQFADAVSGKTEYIRCAIPTCRQWVQIKKKAHGKGKMYCSDRCKKRAQRMGIAKSVPIKSKHKRRSS